MPYELIELSTGNMVGYYDSEEAALRVVADTIRRHGREAVATMAMGFDAQDGRGYAIAEGDALAERAHAALAHLQVPQAQPPNDPTTSVAGGVEPLAASRTSG